MIKDYPEGTTLIIVKQIDSTNSIQFDTEEELRKFEDDIGFNKDGVFSHILGMDYYRMCISRGNETRWMLILCDCFKEKK